MLTAYLRRMISAFIVSRSCPLKMVSTAVVIGVLTLDTIPTPIRLPEEVQLLRALMPWWRQWSTTGTVRTSAEIELNYAWKIGN
jgi:hypothetical protein